MPADSRSLVAAVRVLRDPGQRKSAASVIDGNRPPAQPGLYSWWVDSEGARDLSDGLGLRLRPGLIYAGQAGATRWPSGKRSPATLATRITSGHLGHSIDGSTFRLTLAAILRSQGWLEMRSGKYLTHESEAALTAWMLEHLSVATVAVGSGDTLTALEEAVLAELDPPLNLDGMPSSETRVTLSRLRRELRQRGASIHQHPQRIGLVGCVKSKRTSRVAAADLYTSALFRGRRRAVERTCDRWFILSAKHGLISPERRIAPYDLTLTRVSADQRRRWAERVLRQLGDELGSVAGTTFEIHAGAAYADWGLVDGLRERGAQVMQPAKGLGMGEQLAMYRMSLRQR